MTKVFPALDGVRLTHCWHGSIGMTFDFRPHIGTYEGMHYVLGMNGAGVLTGTYLGNIAGQRILGMPDTETMFDGKDFPTRPFYKGRPWFLPATMPYFALRDALGR